MRSCRLLIVLVLAACAGVPAVARAATMVTWGDYRHDYLLPEERRDRVRFFGYLTGNWVFEELPSKEDPGSTSWENSLGEGSVASLWLAGSPSRRVEYFAEGLYFYAGEEFEAGQVRGDVGVYPRALSLRFGRFWFPFGIEMRGAPSNVNRFVTRPPNLSQIVTGIGVYGDVLDESINYFLAVSNDYPVWGEGGYPDTSREEPEETEESSKAIGGRVALSPQIGIELGFSYARQEVDKRTGSTGTVLGGDFSIDGGPLHLQAEGSRMKRTQPGAPASESSLFYARFAYRLIEDSEKFESVEVLLGAELVDPDREVNSDRETTFLGGFAVAPTEGFRARAEYQFRKEQTNERDNDLFVLDFLLFW